MKTADFVRLALQNFNRVPRTAIRDLVMYDHTTELYKITYSDQSELFFSNSQLGSGIRDLTDLNFIEVLAINPITFDQYPVYIYKEAIRGYIDCGYYRYLQLRDGRHLAITSHLPRFRFYLN